MTQVVVRTAEEAKAAAASGKSAEQFAGAGRAVAEQMQADVSKLPTLVDTSQTVDRARVEA